MLVPEMCNHDLGFILSPVELICLRDDHFGERLVVVILFPKEYNMIHSIRTTFQQFHKCIPTAVAREVQWLIELTTTREMPTLENDCIYRVNAMLCEKHILAIQPFQY